MAEVEYAEDYAAARLEQIDGRIAGLKEELKGLEDKRAAYAPKKSTAAKKD